MNNQYNEYIFLKSIITLVRLFLHNHKGLFNTVTNQPQSSSQY
jgi:hypothetical protein